MATSRLVFAWPVVLRESAKCDSKIFVPRKTKKDKHDMYNCTMKLRKNRVDRIKSYSRDPIFFKNEPLP